MTSDPSPSPEPLNGSLPDGGQPAETSRFAPARDPRPDTRWAWAEPQTRTAGSWAASPEAANAASAWGVPTRRSETSAWASPATPPSEDRGGQARTTQAWSPRGSAEPVRRPVRGVGSVVVVALVSAVLASGGTALALSASGALERSTASSAAAASAAVTSGAGTADDSSAVIASSSRVSPAVVKITTGGEVDPFSGNQTDGVGSGIIYDAEGWILTNHHVVSGAAALIVQTKDGQTYHGTVYGIDTLTDLAIVKVEATGLPAATLGSSDSLKVGQLVVAVGSPLGTYSFSVTSGIVSGKGRSVMTNDGSTISNLIQTDAAINAGNAGGPLADADGNVVGISTVFADANGIGFAIPIDIAKPIMAQAVKGEKLERPWIGVRYQAINQKVKEAQGLSVDGGALITTSGSSAGSAIQPNSPAMAAGLKDGDVITEINGIAIDQEHPLNLLLVQFEPKTTIQLTVLRGGQTLTVPVTLGVRPEGLQ